MDSALSRTANEAALQDIDAKQKEALENQGDTEVSCGTFVASFACIHLIIFSYRFPGNGLSIRESPLLFIYW